MPNVRLFFNHKLTGADFRKCKAWFEVKGDDLPNGRAREIEIDFDFMIGADGAHSAVRYHLMKFVRMNYHQEYIDTLWCEFQIKPREEWQKEEPLSRYQISPNHLHIWPGKDFMFIAIPSEVRIGLVRILERSLLNRSRMGHSPAPCSYRVASSRNSRATHQICRPSLIGTFQE
jgi:hypothetical protein